MQAGGQWQRHRAANTIRRRPPTCSGLADSRSNIVLTPRSLMCSRLSREQASSASTYCAYLRAAVGGGMERGERTHGSGKVGGKGGGHRHWGQKKGAQVMGAAQLLRRQGVPRARRPLENRQARRGLAAAPGGAPLLDAVLHQPVEQAPLALPAGLNLVQRLLLKEPACESGCLWCQVRRAEWQAGGHAAAAGVGAASQHPAKGGLPCS